MSKDFPIPPDYSSIALARDRARAKWGTSGDAHLHGLLSAGRIRVQSSGRNGETTDIAPTYWTPDTVKIALLEESAGYSSGWNGPSLSLGRPVVNDDDLDRELPSFASQLTGKSRLTKETAPSRKMPIGRPPNSDGDAFWIEAFRLVLTGQQAASDASSQTQKTFAKAMVTWAQKSMDKPFAEDTIDKKIQALWKVVRATQS